MTVTEANMFEIVAALHNASTPVGLGHLRATGPIDAADARQDLAGRVQNGQLYIDYFRGRPLKVMLVVGEEVGLRLFDRDAGQGAGKRALERLAVTP